MSLNKHHPRTIAFAVSQEDYSAIQMRATIGGKCRREYFIESLLTQKVVVTGGKYHGDRLSIEVRKLRERLETMDTDDEKLYTVLLDCRALTGQLVEILTEQEGLYYKTFVPKNR